MAVAIEDAGFEIRDMIEWVYGSGFPKSLDVSKALDKSLGHERQDILQEKPKNMDNEVYGKGLGVGILERKPSSDEAKHWNGYGTALKPAHEPICMARKPIEGTVAQNVLKHGTGGLNIDGTRVIIGDDLLKRYDSSFQEGNSQFVSETATHSGKRMEIKAPEATALGRFPANLIHDGSDEVEEIFPQGAKPKQSRSGKIGGLKGEVFGNGNTGFSPEYVGHWPSDNGGSASRYFFSAKPDLYCSLCYGIMELCENNVKNAQTTSQLGTQASNTAQDNVAVKQVQEPKDSKPNKNKNAHNAVNSSASTSQTTESIAQPSVTQNLKELLDLTAKYAESQCLKCQTSIAQKLVAMATENTGSPASRDFMQDFKSSTHNQNLVKTVEILANIDITQTTINLTKLCGFAHLATDERTKQANQENSNDFYRHKYSSKASKRERNAGLEGFEVKGKVYNGQSDTGAGKAKGSVEDKFSTQPSANHHPTVKPLSLTKYLATLIKPPKGGRLLVPFSGSGSEMIGALQAGWEHVEGVELTEEYIPIAEARIKYWLAQKEIEDKKPKQTGMFNV